MARKPNKRRPPAPILDPNMGRPTSSDLYHWCDYVELRCLVDKDRRISRGRVLELLDDTAQMHGEQTDADLANAVDDVVRGVAANGPGVDEADEGETEEVAKANERGQLATRAEMRVAGWFTNLAFRAKLFGASYPFQQSPDGQELQALAIDTKARELYVQLLLSASLRLIPKHRHAELTETFEEASHVIFKNLMPTGWEVHRFGAKGAHKYTGTLFEKLQALCKDLRGKLMLNARHFKPGDRGDGGLDLVAWHPMAGDQRDGLPVALAQCGCTSDGDEWSKKSLEASPAKLRPHIHMLHPWVTYYFMPHDLVEAVGNTIDWQHRSKLTETIVIDRSRLMKLAELYEATEQCAVATHAVQEAAALAY